MTLADFVRELLNDADLQEVFAKDPDDVMTKAGLSDSERALIWRRDREQIGAAMGPHQGPGSPGGAPPPWPTSQLKIDTIATHSPGGAPPPWPTSQLKIDTIATQGPGGPPPPWPTSQLKIDTVDTAARDARTVTLFISGHWFAPEIACKLVLADKELDATVLSVTSGEHSTMIASVALDPSTAAGAWDVKLINDRHVYDTYPEAIIA